MRFSISTITQTRAIGKTLMVLSGGDEGARTPDLNSAIVALSQLSYIPWRIR